MTSSNSGQWRAFIFFGTLIINITFPINCQKEYPRSLAPLQCCVLRPYIFVPNIDVTFDKIHLILKNWHAALTILKQVMEEKLNSTNVEVAAVTVNQPFHVYSKEQVEEIIKEIA